MKFFVNENCIGCGLCVSVCPDVFHMTPDGVSKAAEESVSGGIADSAMLNARTMLMSRCEIVPSAPLSRNKCKP